MLAWAVLFGLSLDHLLVMGSLSARFPGRMVEVEPCRLPGRAEAEGGRGMVGVCWALG